MKQIIKTAVTAFAVSFVSVACNNEDTKTASESSDTSQNATTAATDNAAQNADMDATKVDPAHYKLLADTMGIRIVEAAYQPGDSSPMHSHPDGVLYVAQGGTATFYSKDGSKTETTVSSGTGNVTAAGTHSVKNTGKAPLRAILFEVNRGTKPMTWDATLDATKVAPNRYKLLKDSLGIRVIEVAYKPGESAGMHAHPDAALYVIEGSTAEFTRKDGSKQIVEMKKGTTMIVPTDTHSAKNVGKTTMKGVLVEVNRSME